MSFVLMFFLLMIWINRQSRLDFRRLPGPVLILPDPLGAHFPEQRLVIEPTDSLKQRKHAKNDYYGNVNHPR